MTQETYCIVCVRNTSCSQCENVERVLSISYILCRISYQSLSACNSVLVSRQAYFYFIFIAML